MASQLYSRYVPPSKKPSYSLLPSATTTPEFGTPLQPTPPPTRKDASATYERYIPSLKTKHISGDDSNNHSPSQREFSPPKRRQEVSVESLPDRPKKPKKRKLEEAQTKSTHGEASEDKETAGKKLGEHASLVVENEDDVHRRLLEKREKSLRKAAKLAKKASKHKTLEDEAPPEPLEIHDLVPLPQPEPVADVPAQSSMETLPSWIKSPIRVTSKDTAPFVQLGIPPEVSGGLEKKGFKNAFAIQTAVLPLLLPGPQQQEGDLLVAAATGSGKTLAYVLPMIENLSHNQVIKLRGVIVLPTRELVSQAREVAETCSSVFIGRRVLRMGSAVGNETFKSEQASLMGRELVYDPMGYQKQLDRLNSKWENSENGSDTDLCDDEIVSHLPDHVYQPVSKIDILICTPGRLVEHVKSTPGFTLRNVKWLVIDEADKLLDQSFQQWLEVAMTPMNKPRKVILSATMTKDVGQLSGLKLRRPKLVVLEEGDIRSDSLYLPPLLEESGVKVDDEDAKPLYLMEILKRVGLSEVTQNEVQLAENERNSRGVLIFTKSNETAIRLARLIALLEPSKADEIGTLTSTTRSSVRKAALKSFEAGTLSILVASDLVSRGLDLSNLAHVVNYDVPTSLTAYVHRVGRTARAGKAGHAWTLFTPSEGRWFWNEIGRADSLQRSGKVQRMNINADLFKDQRLRYQELLEELGREAGTNG